MKSAMSPQNNSEVHLAESERFTSNRTLEKTVNEIAKIANKIALNKAFAILQILAATIRAHYYLHK